MADSEIKNISYDEWWTKLTGSLAFIFVAILFVDINTEGQNIAIRIISLAGVIVCLSAVLYHDYRVQFYDRLKKRAMGMLFSALAVLIITAAYLFVY